MTTDALSVNPTSRKRDVPAIKSGRLSALRSDRYAVGGTTLQIDRKILSKAVDVKSHEPALKRATADGNVVCGRTPARTSRVD